MESESFWDFYWETRLRSMETLGKREAILAASALVRRLARAGLPARMLELGCGDGQIIGALAEAHAQARGIEQSLGVDYLPEAVAACQKKYPRVRFREGDFTDPALLDSLGQFEIVLLVNALHEVFSAAFSPQLGEVDAGEGKQQARAALILAALRLVPGGYLLLFDGLEPPGAQEDLLRVRFLDRQARADFDTFAREYRPLRIRFRVDGDPLVIELPRRDFARFIDKSIFLGKLLWETERLESYQYFTEEEFRQAFAAAGLEVTELRTLTVNEDKWRSRVVIETPGEPFPAEHVLIIGRRREEG